MSPEGAVLVPFPPKTGTNILQPRPPPIVELVRLVAQGFWQVEGVHYTEKYSPTLATASIRMLLAMAPAKDGELSHFDAEWAFLKANIDEEIYIEILEEL